MRRSIVLLLFAVALTASFSGAAARSESRRPVRPASTAFQQHAGHAPGEVHPGLSLAVDGALHPELIPDERAWAHFLGAMASADAKTREVALKKAGLDDADRAAFGGALGTLRGELAEVETKRKTGGAAAQLLQHQQMAVANARDRVGRALTGAGWSSLEGHVLTVVKSRIKIYRGPMPLPAQGGGR